MKVGWLEQVVFVYSFHHNKPTDMKILQFETAFEIAGTNCINRGENKRRRFWSNWGSWSEVTKPDFQFHSLVFLIIWTSEHVGCPGIGSAGECTTRASWRARRPSWGSCRSPTEIWSELSSSRWVLVHCDQILCAPLWAIWFPCPLRLQPVHLTFSADNEQRRVSAVSQL